MSNDTALREAIERAKAGIGNLRDCDLRALVSAAQETERFRAEGADACRNEQRARIAELERQLKEHVPRAEMDRLAEWWKTECRRVIAERDALKQDAERWRFVRHCIAQHFQDYGRLTWEHFEGGCVPVFERRHDQDWDDAIDDAMLTAEKDASE